MIIHFIILAARFAINATFVFRFCPAFVLIVRARVMTCAG